MTTSPARRKTRRDALPEHTAYRDTGCEFAPRCLSCPLPECWYITKRPYETPTRNERERRARELRQRGLSQRESAVRVAAEFSLSLRQAYRYTTA